MVKSKSSKPSKSGSSTSKANAAGYAKRHSGKEKKTSLSDVYEFTQGKVRRSKVRLELDRDEDMGGGDDAMDEVPRARLVGEEGEDDHIDSGDDEEIDSDEAFEESDEGRFAGFNFSRKVAPDSMPILLNLISPSALTRHLKKP